MCKDERLASSRHGVENFLTTSASFGLSRSNVRSRRLTPPRRFGSVESRWGTNGGGVCRCGAGPEARRRRSPKRWRCSASHAEAGAPNENDIAKTADEAKCVLVLWSRRSRQRRPGLRRARSSRSIARTWSTPNWKPARRRRRSRRAPKDRSAAARSPPVQKALRDADRRARPALDGQSRSRKLSTPSPRRAPALLMQRHSRAQTAMAAAPALDRRPAWRRLFVVGFGAGRDRTGVPLAARSDRDAAGDAAPDVGAARKPQSRSTTLETRRLARDRRALR